MPPVSEPSAYLEVLPATEGDPTDRLIGGFARQLDRLGPFASAPRLAVGVSGGADSLALAILADQWVRERGGTLLALIVDHGLRPVAANEASRTAAQLAGLRIRSRILTLVGLSAGPGQAARARTARLTAMQVACAQAGIIDLLLGHHRADLAETLMMRALSNSGADGFAGIAALRHLAGLRVLRPLLDCAPDALRRMLQGRGVAWVDDPSNVDPSALRSRLRGIPPAAADELTQAARVAAAGRAAREAATGDWLAAHTLIRPEGFVVIPPGPLPAAALAALIQMVAGAAYPPPAASVQGLAVAPRPATLGGVRLLAAGSWGPGWLIVREAASMAPACAAAVGSRWDCRFRLLDAPPVGPPSVIGPLGPAAARLRRSSALPGVVLASLPGLWCGGVLVGLPQFVASATLDQVRFVFDPPRPAACCPFVGT